MALGRSFFFLLVVQVVCLKLSRGNYEAELIVDNLKALVVLLVSLLSLWRVTVNIVERPYHRGRGLLFMGALGVIVAASVQMMLALLGKPVGVGNFCTRLQMIELAFCMTIIYMDDRNTALAYISRQFNRIQHTWPPPPLEGPSSSPPFSSHVVNVRADTQLIPPQSSARSSDTSLDLPWTTPTTYRTPPTTYVLPVQRPSPTPPTTYVSPVQRPSSTPPTTYVSHRYSYSDDTSDFTRPRRQSNLQEPIRGSRRHRRTPYY